MIEEFGTSSHTLPIWASVISPFTMGWKSVVVVLCVYGFFKEFRPSEPFISPFLNGPHKNFTEEEINQQIYPVATYSNLSLLVIVFLLTDWLRYKPVIILGGFAGIITWTLLPLGQGISVIQVSQFFYGLFCATEVAYYSYLYAKLEKKHYQRATSITKSVILVGKASSGLASQGLLYFCLMDYMQLNFITLGALSLATVWAFFFPSVSHSLYFHNPQIKLPHDKNDNSTEVDKLTGKNGVILPIAGKDSFVEKRSKSSLQSSFKIIVKNFNSAIKDKYVIKWSLWWSASLCGYLQVVNYMQLLWQVIINTSDKDQPLYHGYISTAHCIIGAICTYLVGFLKLRWDIYGELILAVCSILQGCVVLYSTGVDALITNYILYITFRAVYQSSNTIASSEIAKHIHSESYALIFGINTFIALLGQSILTVVVIDLLKLDIKSQFLIYGSYYVVIGTSFALVGSYTIIKHLTAREKKDPVNV